MEKTDVKYADVLKAAREVLAQAEKIPASFRFMVALNELRTAIVKAERP